MTQSAELSLLNIFEVEAEEGVTHLVAFLDPVRAGASGILTRSVVGSFVPDAAGEFDAHTFAVNPEFVAAFVDYMNQEPDRVAAIRENARAIPGQWLYLVDPRDATPRDEDPPPSDILGCFAVDDSGQVVPNSFQYNAEHKWFSIETGVSGLLEDRRFYDWLNPSP